jgi:hypothetical protein
LAQHKVSRNFGRLEKKSLSLWNGKNLKIASLCHVSFPSFRDEVSRKKSFQRRIRDREVEEEEEEESSRLASSPIFHIPG